MGCNMKFQLSAVVFSVDSHHNDTARPQDVVGGSCHQVRRTAVNVLN